MKRIAVLLICIILGTACLTGCANRDEAFTQKNYIADGEQITEVCIDVRDRQIEVMLSPDNQIHLDYFESSKEYYDISVSDTQVLTMTAASNKDWTDYIGGISAAGSRKILLQLPHALLETLQLSTTNEDISLSPLTVASDLSLTSHGGNIVFDKLNVGNSVHLNAKNLPKTGDRIKSCPLFSAASCIKLYSN